MIKYIILWILTGIISIYLATTMPKNNNVSIVGATALILVGPIAMPVLLIIKGADCIIKYDKCLFNCDTPQ